MRIKIQVSREIQVSVVMVSVMLILLSISALAGASNNVQSTFKTAYFSWFWNPAARMWNPYTPQNYLGWPIFTYMPLADYSDP
ncbi:hypothetical protein, partial [Caldivirga sp.]|uniref:hypothetical protein n=1 Tax=Caldivirga sp. TaxID=2080243 RepID=UPI003D110AD9